MKMEAAYQSFTNAAEAVLGKKYVMMISHRKGRETESINKINLHLKELGSWNKWIHSEKKNKDQSRNEGETKTRAKQTKQHQTETEKANNIKIWTFWKRQMKIKIQRISKVELKRAKS